MNQPKQKSIKISRPNLSENLEVVSENSAAPGRTLQPFVGIM